MVKDQVAAMLQSVTEREDWQEHGATAEDFSQRLGVRRNTISAYLNDLYKEKIAIKLNSRPVNLAIFHVTADLFTNLRHINIQRHVDRVHYVFVK